MIAIEIRVWFNVVLVAGTFIATQYLTGFTASKLAGVSLLVVILAFFGVLTFQAIQSFLLQPSAREKRLGIIEADWGRKAGWYVEYQHLRLALLTDPRYEDMFWVSYQIKPLTDDPEKRSRILSDRDWWLRCEFLFRNARFGDVAPDAFAAGDTFPEPGRVTMRALYLDGEPPNRWEQILLWWRTRARKCPPSDVEQPYTRGAV